MRRVNSLGSLSLRRTGDDFLLPCGGLESFDADKSTSILGVISGLDDLQKTLQAKLNALTVGAKRLPTLPLTKSHTKLSFARAVQVRSQSTPAFDAGSLTQPSCTGFPKSKARHAERLEPLANVYGMLSKRERKSSPVRITCALQSHTPEPLQLKSECTFRPRSGLRGPTVSQSAVVAACSSHHFPALGMQTPELVQVKATVTLRPHTSQPQHVAKESRVVRGPAQEHDRRAESTKKAIAVDLSTHTSTSSNVQSLKYAQVRGDKYANCCTLQSALRENGWTQCSSGQEPAGGWDLIWGSSADIGREMFGSARYSLSSRVCLVNHFCRERCKRVANKCLLLHLLREIHQPDDLFSWAPRSYDLSKVPERTLFIADFLESTAEALATRASKGRAVSQTVLTAALDILKSPAKSLHPVGEQNHERSMEKQAERLSFALRYQDCAAEDAADDALSAEAVNIMKDRAENPQRQVQISSSHNLWLVKKSNLENGDGVRVDQRLSEILRIASDNFEWGCVVQKYVERPLVVQGRKMDLRIWMLISSWNPMQAWLWSEPYARLASKSFNFESLQIQDPLVHLTNRSQQKKGSGSAEQCDSQPHCWTLQSLLDWLKGPGGFAEDVWEKQVWPKLVALARNVLVALEAIYGLQDPKGVKCFELLGLDVLLDDGLAPWFLEANTSPDLCNDAHPDLQASVGRCLQSGLGLVKRARDEKDSRWLPAAADVEACDGGLALAGGDSWRLIRANRT